MLMEIDRKALLLSAYPALNCPNAPIAESQRNQPTVHKQPQKDSLLGSLDTQFSRHNI